MPQKFQVLKCHKCSVFQIHQTKKSNKFECKMCGEKQSIKRHYGIGTGKDCRMHVQKLNVLRGNMTMKDTNKSNSNKDIGDVNEIPENIENFGVNPFKRSRWSTFIDKAEEKEAPEEPMFLGDREVLLVIPKKSKTRKFKAKVEASSSEDYSDANSFDTKLKCNMRCINDNIDNFESEEVLSAQDHILIYKDVSTNCQKQLKNYYVDNVITEKSSEKPIVLQTINKNSKWARYVIDDKDIHNVVLANHNQKECLSNSNSLFSLCDDNDIDQVLDI